jgi:hypothetical protein
MYFNGKEGVFVGVCRRPTRARHDATRPSGAVVAAEDEA